MLHGLEGSRASHYVGGFLSQARAARVGRDTARLSRVRIAANQRAVSTIPVRRLTWNSSFVLCATGGPPTPLLLAGVSLGGNVLLKWLGEKGASVNNDIRAAAAVSVPFDL